MQAGLLNQINSLVAGNERLIEFYRSMYYLLPTKETNRSRMILWLIDKREELELELKKCSFNIKNSGKNQEYTTRELLRFMPILLRLENLVRLKFKDGRQNLIYLEERKFLKKYLELLSQENLSNKVFKMLLRYKRLHKTV